ncbi:MAG: cysteine synthase A [Nitrospirota bacterium]
MKIPQNILEHIGSTPFVKLHRIVSPYIAEIWAKLEGYNPGGSVKDRIALSMIESAEKDGRLKPGGTIVEPTSGNTGIGLAMVAAVKGYRLILTMSEAMSIERRKILLAHGAELVLTPFEKGMKGAIEKAEELIAENKGYFMPDQFANPANPEIHRRTTAREILDAIGKETAAFIAGVGTGGTITGVGEVLKEKIKEIKIIAVEPAFSPVLSGGMPGPHRIEGIGAGFIPSVLNTKIYDRIIAVTDDDAEYTARRLAKEEGIFAGTSSGASAWAAIKVAEEIGKGGKVIVIFPDRGDRYLSTKLFDYG